jgi:hypothetical protein
MPEVMETDRSEMIQARTRSCAITLALGLVLTASGAGSLLFSQQAVAEIQQTGTPLSNPTTRTTQAGQATKITPEQEAALVEVRKILQEARQVADNIEILNKLTTKSSVMESLQRVKSNLLQSIELAQLRAGDFSVAAKTVSQDLFFGRMALEQVHYGQIEQGAKTASHTKLHHDTLFALVDALMKVGDTSAALSVAETQLDKENFDLAKNQAKAQLMALVARRQHEAGDPASSATLRRAADAAAALKRSPSYQYPALVSVAEAQAVIVDRATSTETFRQATEAALAQRENNVMIIHALKVIAKVQARSGDAKGSVQTFEKAGLLINDLQDPQVRAYLMSCIGRLQILGGDRAAGQHTFRQAIQDSETLPNNDRGPVLVEIGNQQVKIGDRQAVYETVERLRNAGLLQNAKILAAKAGDIKMAMKIDGEIPQSLEEEANSLQFFAQVLIETKDPFGTPEVFQQLSQKAFTLLKNPLPKDTLKANGLLRSVSHVQAAAGDVSTALRTAERISSRDGQMFAYEGLVKLLTAKGDLPGAKQVANAIKEDWLPWGNTVQVMHDLARTDAKHGIKAAALAWAEQQQNSYAKSDSLIGVAEGFMDRLGVEDASDVEALYEDKRFKCD